MHANVHDALLAKLLAYTPLTSLLADSYIETSPSEPAIYDHVPQVPDPETDGRFPYVAIGDFTAINEDTDDRRGQEHTHTFHIWSRYHGGHEARRIADELRNALHDQRLSLSAGHFVYCFWEFAESVPEPDHRLTHVAVRVRTVTQD